MGNICRSPAAEGFFAHHLAAEGLQHMVQLDSAGTHGYHLGNAPDPRAIRACAARGVDLGALRARQVKDDDFHTFDLVVAMDGHNFDTLAQMNSAAGANAKVLRMMQFSPRFDSVPDVPDPYYGEQSDFEYMCELLDESTRGLLDQLKQNHGRID
jgi:protein-tyrosine phosphatase